MIERYGWDDLPRSVRDAIVNHVGVVGEVEKVEKGQNCDVALVLHGTGGARTFLKGVRGISPRMRWLRNEAEAGELATGLAPAALFSEDIEEDAHWFVVGFEYLSGHPADLAPDSPDLPMIAATVDQISAFPGHGRPPLSERWSSADWWNQLAAAAPGLTAGLNLVELTEWCHLAAEMVAGDRLIHTDLHEHQFMINGNRPVRVIDWGRPASGAPWVDTAFLVVRLIAAGHQPRDAEEWAALAACWSTRSDKAVTAFACYVAGLWSYRAATTPFPGSARLAKAARDYAEYRLST